MPRGSFLPALALCCALLGCRADDEDCGELARHAAELAEAEGKGVAGLAIAVERDCKEHRPTRALVECMMAAETLAELGDC